MKPFALVLGLALCTAGVIGCRDTLTAPSTEETSPNDGVGRGVIRGIVLGMGPAADSADYQPVANVTVRAYLVSSVPPDTIPPDTIPPDTVPPDTVPPDTVPPDTVPQPPDSTTGPPDSTGSLGFRVAGLLATAADSVPTPPPEPVAEVVTDEAGGFKIRRLPAGVYLLAASPEPSSPFTEGGTYAVSSDTSKAEVTIYLGRKR
jgi:hypothetical protein